MKSRGGIWWWKFWAGKSFSVTGWKVGWVIGPEELVKGVCLANNWIQFSVATPLQEAVGAMIEQASLPYQAYDSFYHFVAHTYQLKRNGLVKSLQDAGLTPVVPQGGIFIYCDISAADESILDAYQNESQNLSKDWKFCNYLTIEKRVTAIPASAFYSEEYKELGTNWVRFAFCKEDDILIKAGEQLKLLSIK